MGKPVLSPEIIDTQHASSNYFVLVAVFFSRDIVSRLEKAGFVVGESYLPYRAIKPRDYAVEVAGVCNLRCIACPRENRDQRSERPKVQMKLETFKAVINKIRREDPFVGNIQLYQWGEPSTNHDLPAMITYARDQGILSAISSNLNIKADYRSIIAAKPEWLRLSASGIGRNYEVTHTGGKWDDFLVHLAMVARFREHYYPSMKVEFYYHRYKHSKASEQTQIEQLCSKYNFEFHPVPAYLIGLDDVLLYCEGKNLPPAAAEARALLLQDLDNGLALAKSENELPCDVLDSILINSDLSISGCMMYYYPENNTPVVNYLDTPLIEIIAARSHIPLCQRCMKHGIHRYCGVYAELAENGRPK